MPRFFILLILVSALFFSCSGNRKPVEKPYTEIILEAEAGTDTMRLHELIDLLSARMDKLGVSQDDFSFELNSGKIIARFSMDAIENPQRLRKMLQADAKFLFRETYSLGEIAAQLKMADSLLKGPPDTLGMYDSNKTGLFELLNLGGSGMSQNGGGYNNQAPLVGMAGLKDTALINQMLNRPEIRVLFPSDIAFHWTQYAIPMTQDQLYGLVAVKTRSASVLDPGKLEEVLITDMDGGGKCLQLQMTDAKAIEWARMTKANIDRCIAIELDDHVFSYPNVLSEITGGKTQISGPDLNELENLKVVMSSGSLPARVRIAEERLVK